MVKSTLVLKVVDFPHLHLPSALPPVPCTGKKSFGRSATDVLNVSVDFAENVGAHPQLGALLFERAGLALSRQLLELAQVLAEATAASSATANEQAAATHRLLCCVAAKLNDDRICAELLQPVSREPFLAF